MDVSNLNNVVITATSAVTAVGADISQTCAAINAGITPFVEHDYITCTPSDPEWDEPLPTYVASVPFINPYLNTSKRLTELVMPAITEVFAKSQLKRAELAKTAMFFALPLSDKSTQGLALNECWLSSLKSQTGLHGLASCKLSNLGNIGVLSLINEAVGLLNSGQLEQCIIGGVDSYLFPERIAYFDKNWRIKSARNVDGFIPGEAAAMLLLETKANAAKRGVKALAEISGFGQGIEEKHFASKLSSNGQGLTTAIKAAVFNNAKPTTVSSIYCDFNGESYYAQEWGLIKVRLAAIFESVNEFNHPADSYGNIGAASGAMLLANAVDNMQKGNTKSNVMVATANDDGQRNVILISNAS